jgi:hypothetical protein
LVKAASDEAVAVAQAGAVSAVATPVASRRARLATIPFRPARVLLPIIATAIVAAGQFAEDAVDSPPLQMLSPTWLLARWTVIALVAYVFVMFAAIEWVVERSLGAVRPVVMVDDATFESYRTQMRRLPPLADAALLLTSAAAAVVLFVGLRSDLLIDDPVTHLGLSLPASPVLAAIICAGYTVIGWAFLRLIFGSGRLARLLAKLTREPLDIQVFDTSPLIPFGNVALTVALAPAGVIVILLIGLGTPTTPVSWSVLIEATFVVVLALLLSLRHIHRQMSAAKDAALGALNARISELYREVAGTVPHDMSEAARLSNSTNALILMRKAVQEMTTWPFRNTVAFGRAVLIAAAPLIYTTLSQLINVFWINRLQ